MVGICRRKKADLRFNFALHKDSFCWYLEIFCWAKRSSLLGKSHGLIPNLAFWYGRLKGPQKSEKNCDSLQVFSKVGRKVEKKPLQFFASFCCTFAFFLGENFCVLVWREKMKNLILKKRCLSTWAPVPSRLQMETLATEWTFAVSHCAIGICIFFLNIFLVSQRAAKVAGFLCEKPRRVLDLFFWSGETPVFCVGGVFVFR